MTLRDRDAEDLRAVGDLLFSSSGQKRGPSSPVGVVAVWACAPMARAIMLGLALREQLARSGTASLVSIGDPGVSGIPCVGPVGPVGPSGAGRGACLSDEALARLEEETGALVVVAPARDDVLSRALCLAAGVHLIWVDADDEMTHERRSFDSCLRQGLEDASVGVIASSPDERTALLDVAGLNCELLGTWAPGRDLPPLEDFLAAAMARPVTLAWSLGQLARP